MNMKKQLSGFSGNGSELIKPEHLMLQQWYSITINPALSYNDLAYDNPEQYFVEAYNDMKRLMIRFSSSVNLHLWVELSSTMKLHFHGLVRYTHHQYQAILFNRELTKSNHVNIDTIGDIMEWHLYCSKNADLMTDIDCIPRTLSTYHYLNDMAKKAHEDELFRVQRERELERELSFIKPISQIEWNARIAKEARSKKVKLNN